MKCLYVASEVAGFAKTGGLADVAAALPAALAERGHEVAVMMPLYGFLRHGPIPIEPTEHRFNVPMGDRVMPAQIWRSTLPDTHVPVYLIDQPDSFDRVDPKAGFGPYQHKGSDGQPQDYVDNCLRFGCFCRAVLEALPWIDFWPDVLHANDWQTGLIPVYLRELYVNPQVESASPGGRYRRIRTLFTIHNLAFQGTFWHLDLPMLGLPWRLFTMAGIEFYGHINFLKGGLVFSDLLTTVSPTYAREIQTQYFGCGLHGVLLQRTRDLYGIVNGIDYKAWNPATDRHLAARFDVLSLAEGKPRCKAALQEALGLEVQPRTPLLGLISRLTDQKGIRLVIQAAADLLARQPVQLVVLGQGDKLYEQALLRLREQFPRQVGVKMEQSEGLAHQIEAGVDAFLMPSRYEPCGLNQLYSLRYGTVPVVRATGGLADTVVDATDANLAAGRATGFAFVPFGLPMFREALERCLRLYRDRPDAWRTLQETGMKQDWSWSRSAAEYERLYRRVVEAR
jgi:starch synthase